MSFPALPCAGGWKHCGAGIVYDLSLLPLLAQPFGSAEPHKQTKNNYIYIKKKSPRNKTLQSQSERRQKGLLEMLCPLRVEQDAVPATDAACTTISPQADHACG